MPMDSDAIAELKKQIKQAKTNPIMFALALGKTPKDLVILMDKRKKGDALLRLVRKAEGINKQKSCAGTASLEGNKLLLRCEVDPPSGLMRHMKAFLKDNGIQAKPFVLAPDGSTFEGEALTAAALVARVQAMQKVIAGLDDDPQAKLSAALPKVVAMIKGSELEKASAALDQLQQMADASAPKAPPPPPPPPGGDPDGGPSGDDALAERWRATADKLVPHIKAALASGKGDPDKIRAVWSYAKGKAEDEKYAAALKSLGPLSTLLSEAAEAQKTAAQEAVDQGDDTRQKLEAWEAVKAEMEPRVKAVIKAKDDRATKVGAAWDMALKAASTADFDKANTIVGRLRDALQASAGAEGGDPGDDPAKASALDKLAQAKGLLTQVTGQVAAFGDPHPQDWDITLQAATRLLAISPDKPVAEIEASVTQATDVLTALSATIPQMTVDRENWRQQEPLFVSRLAPIQAHKMHDQDPVKDQLAELEAELKAARAEAEKFKFKEAAGRIAAFLTKCDVLEALADDLAHYNAIRRDRRELVQPMRRWRSSYPAVQKAYADTIAAYDKAKAKAQEGKFEEAVALLNTVPDLQDAARLLRKREKEVDPALDDSQMSRVRRALRRLNALPDGVQLLLNAGIERVQAAYDANQPDKQPDVLKAAEALTLARREARDLEARGRKAADYVAAMQEFEAAIAIFRHHPGHEGLDDVIARMEADSASAASDAILRKFDAAKRILLATKPDWAAYKARADDFVPYKAKKTEVEERLIELRGHDNAASAVTELAVCDGHMQQAAASAARRDYKGALVSLNAADSAADVVKGLLDMRAKMAELKKDDVLAALDKDVVAAFAVYQDMAKYVTGKDDGTFAALIKQADEQAENGRKASTGASPDLGKVTQFLDAAIAILDGVVERIACKPSYDSQLAMVKPIVKTQLPKESSDNYSCIKPLVEALDRLVDEAEAAVKAPDLDYPLGMAKLNEVQRQIPDARKDVALFVSAVPVLVEMDAINGQLKVVRDGAAALATTVQAKHSIQNEMDKIEAFRTKFLADWRAGKRKASVAQIKQDIKTARAYLAMKDSYKRAFEMRHRWIYAYEHKIAGDPLVQAERDQVAAAKVKIDEYLDLRAFKTVGDVVNDESFAIDRGADILAARDAFEVKRAAAEAKVAQAEAEAAKVASNKAITAKAAALRKRHDDAVAETAIDKRNFAQATRMVDALRPDCQPVIDEAKIFKAYDDARQVAQDKIAEVKGNENAKLIAPLIKRLTGKYDNAVALAEKGNMNQAKALVDVIPQECADALAAAQNNAELKGVSEGLEGLAADDAPAITQAVAKVRGVFDALMAEAEAKFSANEAAAAKAAVEAAEALVASDPAGAKAALPQAVAACEALQLQIGYHKQLSELAKRTTARVTAGMAPYVKYDIVKEDTDALLKKISDALLGARKGGAVEAASAAIEEAMKTYQDLLHMGQRHDKVVTDREELDTARKALLGHAHRYAIREELEALQALLEGAGVSAEGREHDAAEEQIAQAKDKAVDATAKARMATNQPPKVKDIRAILDREDGDAQLDKMIEGLDASAKRRVLRVAFEAKYGCKLNLYANAVVKDADRHAASNIVRDDRKKGPNVRRLYEIMAILPPKDTRDNDSMKIFGVEDVADQRGSYYTGGKKEIVMREGNASLSDVYGFGRPHEVGEVDDNCKPADDKQVDFFSWNTLHEVGHAVDDQRNFMKGVSGNTDYGGWQDHGKDIKPVAKAISDHYKYDLSYATLYIASAGDPPIPDCPDDTDPIVWEQRRTKLRAHVDMARAGNNPWKSATIAAKLNIGGRVYHESYDTGSWCSYDFGARRQAITGYQFRAPGEWFSELYAAFHAKKLKDSHPARPWLEGLK